MEMGGTAEGACLGELPRVALMPSIRTRPHLPAKPVLKTSDRFSESQKFGIRNAQEQPDNLFRKMPPEQKQLLFDERKVQCP